MTMISHTRKWPAPTSQKNSRVARKCATRVFWRPASSSKRRPATTDATLASLNSMLCRCQIEVRYAEADAASVMAGAGGVWRKTRAAKTLHGDTAKHPCRMQICEFGAGH